jgi:hypothetical protein
MGFGHGQYPGKVFQVHADAEALVHLVFAHFGQQAVDFGGELGKVDMAMGINKHKFNVVPPGRKT